MVAQPQSIGHGLNLQGGGQHIIWFGVPWDLTIWLQAIDRLRRQGSPFEHIFVHCLLMDKTIDTKVRGVLKGKDRTQGALLRAMLAPYR
jgi:SNF2 family DNA or RNA helicase